MYIPTVIEKQQALEEEAIRLGAERYRKERPMPWRTDAATAQQEEEANLPPGRQLLKIIIDPLAARIEEEQEARARSAAGRSAKALPMLHLMMPEEVAYITARHAVNSCNRRLGLQSVARDLAELLRDHLNYDSIKRNEPAFFRSLMRANKKAGNYGKTWRTKIRRSMKAVERLLVNWSTSDKVNIGVKCLELLVDAVPDLFEIAREPNLKTGRKELILRPTPKLTDWLERQHARCELLCPVYLPMVTPPKPWTSPFSGGYIGNRVPLVKGASRVFLEDLASVDMPEVYEALNTVQSVPWSINRGVLDVVREVWRSGHSLGDLPRREDHPLPARPDNIDTDESALLEWKRRAAQVYAENARIRSKRIATSQVLWVAEKFENEPAIYYPHNIDFRGRVYPIPMCGPSPQGDDVQKALLRFAEGKPLGERGAHWLAIHIANLFGVDKVSFEERVAWVEANEAALLDSGNNPLDGQRFWTTADSPYCALAACIEWAGYRREGPTFVSHLPIALDGSNSGLQHFSAMLRDPEGAACVNLVPGPKPADIYSSVAQRVQVVADTTDNKAGKVWANGKVLRRIAKRPVMTYCYSATRFGMQEMILQELEKIDLELKAEGKPPHLGGANNYDAASWLSHEMFAAIGMAVSAASGAMDWLKSVASAAAKTGLPIRWTSPIGLPVVQNYRREVGERIKVFINGQEVKFRTSKPTMEIDVRGQASAVAPNFVHSCDASHLMRVALAARRAGIHSLAVIHDSFGTHAADTDRLSSLLRETLVEQYSSNVLAQFREELADQLPEDILGELPPLPPQGRLNLDDVRHASYAFA